MRDYTRRGFIAGAGAMGATALAGAVSLASADQAPEPSKEITVVFTSDIHCAFDQNLTLGAVAAYYQHVKERTPNALLVDLGDAIQGNVLGSISAGELPMNDMELLPYDLRVLGNHEFDYGTARLAELVDGASAQFLSANYICLDEDDPVMPDTKPYQIYDFDGVKVGFIGLTTPTTLTSTRPTYFMGEDGEFAYTFAGDDPQTFYALVQWYVGECREQGCDHVIVLSHLGYSGSGDPFSVEEVVAATAGIDAFLDGHAHVDIAGDFFPNILGEPVPVASCGTQLCHMGTLTICPDGPVITSIVGRYPFIDEQVNAQVAAIQAECDAEVGQVVASSDVTLAIADEKAIRLVRNRECPLGDFAADAIRIANAADIGFANGGGLRADIKVGELTYGDIIAVMPFGNTTVVAEATGEQVMDALEYSCSYLEPNADDGQAAIGEFGGFLQVSGVRFRVNAAIPTPVTLDENGLVCDIEGERRVHDVEVIQPDGTYAPIDLDATYRMAGNDYIMCDMGNGYSMLHFDRADVESIYTEAEALIAYVTDELGGTIDQRYAAADGRIVIDGTDGE